jgi:hypothetical protein
MSGCVRSLVIAAVATAAPAWAQDAASDLAKKLSNPVSSLISVPFQYNHNSGIGGGEGTQDYVNIQPVIPFSLGPNWNLISRTVIPAIGLDGVPPGAGKTTGFGNVVQSFFFSPAQPTAGGVIWGAGPVFQLPTSTNDILGPDQFGAGVTGVVLAQKNGWTYGILANHIWSLNNEDRYGESSVSFAQPFLTYSTPGGTSFGLNTESTYDWKAEQWAVPINATVSQIVKLGNQPVQFTGGVRYWADSPPGGPEGWGYRFAVTYLFPK